MSTTLHFDRRGINEPCARLCHGKILRGYTNNMECFDAENYGSPQIGARGDMGA
jgi:hypothetical protein